MCTPLYAQQLPEEKSTRDLSFLLGNWNIIQTYAPQSEHPRVLEGSLLGRMTLDDQFILCTYAMQRPGKKPARNEVFFNYNAIYETYESMWMSSTWPIKVLLQGQLTRQADRLVLSTSAQFFIQEGVTEFVRDTLVFQKNATDIVSFYRDTYIRTDKQAEGAWQHHMHEVATRIKPD